MPPLSAQKAMPETAYAGPSPARKVLGQTLKFGLATAVVVYLIIRGDIAWEPLRASLGEWRYSFPAFFILALTPAGQFWRWQSLLRSGGLRIPHREVFSYLMVSKFFNMAFPSYVSGDILRGFYVFRRTAEETPAGLESRAPALRAGPQTVVASIVFDRAAGLLPLFVLCLAGLLGSFWHPLPRRAAESIAFVAASGVAGILAFFLFAHRFAEPPELLARLGRFVHLEQPLRYLHEVTHYYVGNMKLIGVILGISFLTQGAGLASFVLFGAALKVDIPLTAYLMLVPLGLMLTAIPVTPAGLGVGQVAFLSLFHLAGTSQGANLYTLYMASFVLINLSGAFLYVSLRSPGSLPQTATPGESERD